MRLRGKEKSNEINIDVDMKRTCHTYRHSFTMISKKEKCSMQITLTKEQVEKLSLKLHLGSMKLGNSVDIRLEATELPKVEPYTVVELEEAVYAPYVQRGNFPVLVDRISCKGIRVVTGKGNV